MNFKKCDAIAIAALVVLMAGSHIFANQAFAISTIAKIIDSIVAGPCTQENGKFYYLVCQKFDPSLLTNGAALKSLLLSDKTVVKNLLKNERPVVKSLLMENTTGLKNLLPENGTRLKSLLPENATASK
jgi:hypothetical protein